VFMSFEYRTNWEWPVAATSMRARPWLVNNMITNSYLKRDPHARAPGLSWAAIADACVKEVGI
jgi:hypothetical protein